MHEKKKQGVMALTRVLAEKFLNLLVAFLTLKVNLEFHDGHLN